MLLLNIDGLKEENNFLRSYGGIAYDTAFCFL